MTPQESVTKRLNALGYAIKRNDRDAWGRKWKYSTFPTSGSGPVNRLDTLHEVAAYTDNVYKVRQWQC